MSEQTPQIERAQSRMTMLALNLQRVFSPVDVAGLLTGAAIGVLSHALGPEKTREYFSAIADELAATAREPGGAVQ